MEAILKRLLFAFALAYSFSVLVARWGTPLSSPHAFRETQTAMTVYWMTRGGPWINYQTPVLGPPWTIPFEFPTFQWCVACLIAGVRGLPIDFAGRCVSWVFLIAGLLPLSRLAMRQSMDPWILSALYLASPVYLYWGTAFLIETCSLFLCLMFLWMMEGDSWVRQLGTCFMGAMAAMTKMTTFAPIALLGFIIYDRNWKRVGILSFSVMAGVVWNIYTDTLKAQNPLSAVLMSNQPRQMLHNFGTLAQRLSWQPWETTWGSVKHLF